MTRYKCFMFVIMIEVIFFHPSKSSVQRPTDGTPNHVVIGHWAAAILKIQGVRILSHMEKNYGNVVLYSQWIQGTHQKCSFIAEYIIDNQTLTLKEHKCKSSKSDIDIESLKKLLKQKTNLNIIEIIHHAEKNLGIKVLYLLDTKVASNEDPCFDIIEFTKIGETLNVKLHNCDMKNFDANFKKIFEILSVELELYEMRIVTHVEVFFKESTIYNLEIEGKNLTGYEERCSAVIECFKNNGRCKSISSHCSNDQAGPDFKNIIKTIEKEINVKVIIIIHREVQNFKDRVVYMLQFTGRDSKHDEVNCVVVVEYYEETKHLILKSKQCTPKEKSDVVPTFQEAILWVQNTLNIKVTEIVHHTEQIYAETIVFTLHLKTVNMNNQREQCLIFVEYWRSSKTYVLKLQMCGLYEVDPNYLIVAELIAKQVKITDIRIVSHVEVTLNDYTVFTVQLKGKDNMGTEKLCFVVVECSSTLKECSIKASQCPLVTQSKGTKNILEWISQTLKVQVSKVIEVHEHEVANKIIYTLSFEIKNKTATSICNAIVDYIMQNNQHLSKMLQCTPKDTFGPNFHYIAKLIWQNFKIPSTQIKGHSVTVIVDQIVYKIWIRQKPKNCLLTITYTIKTQQFVLTSNNCTTYSNMAKDPTYVEIMNWAAQKMNIYYEKIYAHKETVITGGLEYSLSFLRGRKSCYILVHYLYEGRRVYLMSNFCFEIVCDKPNTPVGSNRIARIGPLCEAKPIKLCNLERIKQGDAVSVLRFEKSSTKDVIEISGAIHSTPPST